MAPPIKMRFDHSNPEFKRPPKDGFGFIYMYTFRNGMRYIGQTIRSIIERTVNHTDKLMLVDKVIRSGAKFNIEILSEAPIEYLNQAEDYCIYKFNTLHPNGYNLTVGGQSNVKIITEEMKKKVSEGVRRALNDPVKGKRMRKVSDEQRAIFEKSIICLETGKVYRSMTTAAKDIGCTMENISVVIRGKGNTAKGYHFILFTRYNLENRQEIIDILDEWEKTKREIRDKKAGKEISKAYLKRGSDNRMICVRCIETDRVYRSITQASKKTGIPDWIIEREIKGTRKNPYNIHFEKYETHLNHSPCSSN